jgi:hypothetical protein
MSRYPTLLSIINLLEKKIESEAQNIIDFNTASQTELATQAFERQSAFREVLYFITGDPLTAMEKGTITSPNLPGVQCPCVSLPTAYKHTP